MTPALSIPLRNPGDIARGLTGRNTKRTVSLCVEIDTEYNNYEDTTLERLEASGRLKRLSDSRLCSAASLRETAGKLLCKDCVVDNRKKESISHDNGLNKYTEKHASISERKIVNKIINGYDAHWKKSAQRSTKQLIKNSSIKHNEKTSGIANETTYTCPCPTYNPSLLSPPTNPKSYSSNTKKVSILDHDQNIFAIVSPLINGTGGRATALQYTLMDLPNSESLKRTISRYQHLVGEKIRSVAEKEMELAMVEEIKATILTEKGEEWYNQYYAKPEGEREAIGLTVSFDMGWNKRSSGHKYDSISGHAFIIGVYTRRIIDYVVFSKSCYICNTRTRKNKHADKHDIIVVSDKIIEQEIRNKRK